jgi:hypothetical protein
MGRILTLPCSAGFGTISLFETHTETPEQSLAQLLAPTAHGFPDELNPTKPDRDPLRRKKRKKPKGSFEK